MIVRPSKLKARERERGREEERHPDDRADKGMIISRLYHPAGPWSKMNVYVVASDGVPFLAKGTVVTPTDSESSLAIVLLLLILPQASWTPATTRENSFLLLFAL